MFASKREIEELSRRLDTIAERYWKLRDSHDSLLESLGFEEEFVPPRRPRVMVKRKKKAG